MGASEDRDITNHIAVYGLHPDEEQQKGRTIPQEDAMRATWNGYYAHFYGEFGTRTYALTTASHDRLVSLWRKSKRDTSGNWFVLAQ